MRGRETENVGDVYESEGTHRRAKRHPWGWKEESKHTTMRKRHGMQSVDGKNMREEMESGERCEMKMDRARGGRTEGGEPKIWGTHTVNSRLESYPLV